MNGADAVLGVAVALAGVLIGILPLWRRAMGGGRRLPVWLFRRGDAPLEARAALLAAMRCEFCSEQNACLDQLKAGAARPPAHCPNAALFESLDQSDLTKASRSAGRIPAA